MAKWVTSQAIALRMCASCSTLRLISTSAWPCARPGLKAGLKSRTPPPTTPPEASTPRVNQSSCHLIDGLGHLHGSCDGVARFDPGYHRRAQLQTVAGIGLGGLRNPTSCQAHAVHVGLHTLQGRTEIDHDAGSSL